MSNREKWTLTPSEAAELLCHYNEYRRGKAPYPDVPAERIGQAIDIAVSFLQAAEPNNVRRFRFGSVRYEVFPCNGRYKIVRRGCEVRFVDDSFIYDYCDTDAYIALKHHEEYKQKYFKAKHMAVALFKKQKKQ